MKIAKNLRLEKKSFKADKIVDVVLINEIDDDQYLVDEMTIYLHRKILFTAYLAA